MRLLLAAATLLGGLLPLLALLIVALRAHRSVQRLELEMDALRPRTLTPPVGTTTWMVPERDLNLAIRRQQLLSAREILGDLRGPTALVIAGTVLSTGASLASLYLL